MQDNTLNHRKSIVASLFSAHIQWQSNRILSQL